VLTDIRARDERDAKRPSAPMVPAPDAVMLDTSFLSIDAALQRAIAIVEEKMKAKQAAEAS
jgi:cytidylate kinase